MRSQLHAAGGGRGVRQSRPLRPAKLPVNALTHDWGGLPCLDDAARNPRSKPLRFEMREYWRAIRG